MQTIIRIILWLIALASLVGAGVWYNSEPGFEPLLALLGALPAVLELMISSRGGNTSVKNVESTEGGASIGSKTSGDMNIDGVKTKLDVTITHE